MTLKTALVAVVLSLTPALALAMGCDMRATSSTCPPGQVFDGASQTCIVPATS